MPDTSIPPTQQVVRDDQGRFLPGVSGSPTTQFRPGRTGNPRGRPAAGASVIDWMNVMAEWSEEEIEAMAEDVGAPANKRIAARRLLAAISGNPERDAREAAAFVCAYTHGRPHQSATVEHITPSVARDVEAGRALVQDPELRAIAKAFAKRVERLEGSDQAVPQIVADSDAVVVEAKDQ